MVTPSFSIGTGLTLGGLIISDKAVSIYENNKEILKDTTLIDADAQDDARTMDHPIENGAVVTDHIVLTQIKLRCAVGCRIFLFCITGR